MTLAQLKTAIDTTIGGLTGKVTKARHKAANDVIAAAFYGTEIHDYQGNSGNVIINATPAISGVTFSLFFKKIGNNVFVKGYLTNSSGGSISGGATILNIINSEYAILSTADGSLFGNKADGSYLQLAVITNTIIAGNPISNGETVYINGRYTVND